MLVSELVDNLPIPIRDKGVWWLIGLVLEIAPGTIRAGTFFPIRETWFCFIGHLLVRVTFKLLWTMCKLAFLTIRTSTPLHKIPTKGTFHLCITWHPLSQLTFITYHLYLLGRLTILSRHCLVRCFTVWTNWLCACCHLLFHWIP